MLVSNLVKLKTMPGMFGFNLFQQLSDLLDTPCNMMELINEHLYSCHVLLDEGVPVGRFAIYKNDALRYENKSAICIGAYACIDDEFVSDKLLKLAVEICKDLGYDQVIGPMNGSTWYKYRLKTSEESNSFFLDINNPHYYNKQFETAGFSSIGQYFSNLDDSLEYNGNQLKKFKTYYEDRGALIGNINMATLEDELLQIADFCNDAFANNFLFTPIDKKLFSSKYLSLGALMDPRLIWVVKDQASVIHAICFAIKDVTDKTGKTLIIKTIGTRQGSPFKGIATYLCRNLIKVAKGLGYDKIVHALMFKDNLSLNASEKYGSSFCEYALYGKSLK